jgi:hypothetical protein
MSANQRSRKQPGSGAKAAKRAPKRNVYKAPIGAKPLPPDKSMPKDRVSVK